MYINSTADVINEIDFEDLIFYERAVLKTMIDISFKTRLVHITQVQELLTSMSLNKISDCINTLGHKGFIEQHLLEGEEGYCYAYEVNPFAERVPCV